MKKRQKIRWIEEINRQFLLTFFDNDDEYREIEVNAFHLVKQFDQKFRQWMVSVYTRESFQKRKRLEESKSLISRRSRWKRE